jgi:hypothetical protein
MTEMAENERNEQLLIALLQLIYRHVPVWGQLGLPKTKQQSRH